MPNQSEYPVSVSLVAPRRLLAARDRLTIPELPIRIPALLHRVYEAAAGRKVLDGQNVVLYGGSLPVLDVTAGVGLTGPFEPSGGLVLVETPAGEAAHAVHWGAYAGLSRAHQAVMAWCAANHRRLAGPSWEVYGHWSDDPATLRTDVYWLLLPA